MTPLMAKNHIKELIEAAKSHLADFYDFHKSCNIRLDTSYDEELEETHITALVQCKKDRNEVNITLNDDDFSFDCSCLDPLQNTPCIHLMASLCELEKSLDKEDPDSTQLQKIGGELLSWMEEVKELIHNKNSPEAISPSKEEQISKGLVFILSATASTTQFHRGLLFSPVLTRLNKNGQYSKSQRKKIFWKEVISDPHNRDRNYLSSSDWDILLLAAKNGRIERDDIYLTQGKASCDYLEKLISTGKCWFFSVNNSPLQWSQKKKGEIGWKLLPNGSGQSLELKVEENLKCFHLGEGYFVYYDEKNGTVGPVQFEHPPVVLEKLLDAPTLSHDQTEAFCEILEKELPLLKEYKPSKIAIKEVTADPIPRLHVNLVEEGGWYSLKLVCQLSFEYEGINTRDLKENSTSHIPRVSYFIKGEKELLQINRSIEIENRCHQFMLKQGFSRSYRSLNSFEMGRYERNKERMVEWFLEEIKPKCDKAGFQITYGDNFPIHHEIDTLDWFLETFAKDEKAVNDWFDIEMGVMIDGHRVNILPLLKNFHLTKGKNFGSDLAGYEILKSLDGKQSFKISKERLYGLLNVFSLDFESKGLDAKGRLQLSKWEAHQLEELKLASEKTEMRMLGSNEIYNYGQKLKNIRSIPMVSASPNMPSVLREYQLEGLSWLQFLREAGLNGVLADDMGLGKTVQCLAHIQKEKDEGRLDRPCLIVAPTSLMFNWRNEVKKHTPQLKALVLHGVDRQKDFDKIAEHDIIFTTYPLLARDKQTLCRHHYYLIVLDEAQMIKNSRTQAYQVIQQLEATYRLCLTGTPMENHLGELWSLFNFLMPGFLGKSKVFSKVFRTPIEKKGDSLQQKQLSNRISPFLLRRTKNLVAKDLPEKTEIIREIEMGSQQMDLYEMIRIRAHEKMMREIEKKGIERSQIAVLEALLRLRQVCCDPRLVKTDKPIGNIPSAKMDLLKEMLPQLIEEGRKILLFSQFTSMLSLIEEELKEMGVNYSILTGSTTDRQTPVELFQTGKVPLMLISLKAGGVGLNLTEADTVFHFDPWWNPAVEKQATDRVHRIGQKNKVFVYKLVTTGTVEEKILALQQRKEALLDSLLEAKEKKGLSLTMEELDEVFRPLY